MHVKAHTVWKPCNSNSKYECFQKTADSTENVQRTNWRRCPVFAQLQQFLCWGGDVCVSVCRGAIGSHPWSRCPAAGSAPGWRTSPCGCFRRSPWGRRTGSADSWGPWPWPGCSRPSWWWWRWRAGRTPAQQTKDSGLPALLSAVYVNPMLNL